MSEAMTDKTSADTMSDDALMAAMRALILDARMETANGAELTAYLDRAASLAVAKARELLCAPADEALARAVEELMTQTTSYGAAMTKAQLAATNWQVAYDKICRECDEMRFQLAVFDRELAEEIVAHRRTMEQLKDEQMRSHEHAVRAHNVEKERAEAERALERQTEYMRTNSDDRLAAVRRAEMAENISEGRRKEAEANAQAARELARVREIERRLGGPSSGTWQQAEEWQRLRDERRGLLGMV